ncbi:MAG TPA: hypothetical protein VKA82_08395 [Rubrobacter sp.]|jgi:hypothetical protein|nr:hypothetical protein [Rubrobacter sp.]
MSATLMYVGIGAVLAIGVAILTIAVLFLQTARRYVDLTERRLELLQEGEAFLLKLVQRQGQALEREAERREKVSEMVGNPRGRQQGEESPGSRRPEGLDRHVQETPYTGSSSEVEDEEQRRERTPKADPAPARPKDGAPRLGVQVPHPDDDVPGRGWNNSPARFFQKCYDRYLEHYEGYVRLAERLHQMRDEADATPGTLGKREWEDKLHRAYDAIERTTQRLDMLEEHYPELATDNDRISSRIGTARLHAGLTERFGRPQ